MMYDLVSSKIATLWATSCIIISRMSFIFIPCQRIYLEHALWNYIWLNIRLLRKPKIHYWYNNKKKRLSVSKKTYDSALDNEILSFCFVILYPSLLLYFISLCLSCLNFSAGFFFSSYTFYLNLFKFYGIYFSFLQSTAIVHPTKSLIKLYIWSFGGVLLFLFCVYNCLLFGVICPRNCFIIS